MPADTRLLSNRFPRSAKYNPDWVMAIGMGSHPLWMTEWLTSAMDLAPGMRVLDLGCGKGASSVFLAREFDVQVWAADLWIGASENSQRFQGAGVADRVFPLHCDARGLPFAGEFFDAIVCVDAYSYFGADPLYLNYLAHFVKPAKQIGIASAGLVREFDVRESGGAAPAHLKKFWTQDCWGLQTAAAWRKLWERTRIVDIELSDAMEEGWQVWLDWHLAAHPKNLPEIETLKADRGQYLGYVRMVGRRRADAKLEDYCWPDTMRSFPAEYEKKTLMRDEG